MKKVIEISNLSYSYKSDWTFKGFQALKEINLDIFEGETFGFLGPNGSGKTTTIKCILGLIRPRSGKINILGEDSRSPKARTQVGYLPEQPYFYDHLSVQELMEMYACLAGVEKLEIKTYVKEALQKVGMLDRAGHRMRSLSKGLTQRVAFAQAIVAKPKVLILDEPFSGLDPLGRKEFRDLILELKSIGTTIFMSSHILSDVEFICSRASIAVKGELKGVFNLSELQKTKRTKYELIVVNSGKAERDFINMCETIHKENDLLRLIFSNEEAALLALKKSLDGGIGIRSYRPQHAALEDLFVDIVKSS